MRVHIIIPARLDSTRFPGKLLKTIKGETLIGHICERAKQINADTITVATDNEKIKDVAESKGVNCFYMLKKFTSGTHRCSYVAKIRDYSMNDLVINIQADEYNFSIGAINTIIEYYKKAMNYEVITLISKTTSPIKYFEPNTVKVLVDKLNYATCFTRTPIPYFKERLTRYPMYSHVGIYAYPVELLYDYKNLEVSPYEEYENLEQLRFIYNNVDIKCIEINDESISINSPDDLKTTKVVA